MSAQFLQFLLAGLTIGAIYALVALGFSIIYNASQVINFAQGEFVMIGGMTTVSLTAIGWPLPFAMVAAVLVATLVGFALEKHFQSKKSAVLCNAGQIKILKSWKNSGKK